MNIVQRKKINPLDNKPIEIRTFHDESLPIVGNKNYTYGDQMAQNHTMSKISTYVRFCTGVMYDFHVRFL